MIYVNLKYGPFATIEDAQQFIGQQDQATTDHTSGILVQAVVVNQYGVPAAIPSPLEDED